jgi:hypothetical protein
MCDRDKSLDCVIDCIYVTASAHDARYTRICIASIRYFYPNIVIKLLAGSRLEAGLRDELGRHWDVSLSDVPAGDWGWGFVKLEPLFGTPGERFLIVDSDTVFAGDILATRAASSADFLVDDEQQSESDTHRLYYNWRKVALVDPAARPPRFVFNSGQWFGTAGLLNRDDFALLMDWSKKPPRLRHPELFMPGEQGVLNYVLNRKAMLEGLCVDRRKIMRWPGHGMDDITAAMVGAQRAPAVIVHWAGLKNRRLRAMPGADILSLFERRYYERMPFGALRRRMRSDRYFCSAVVSDLQTRAQLLGRRLRPAVERKLLLKA